MGGFSWAAVAVLPLQEPDSSSAVPADVMAVAAQAVAVAVPAVLGAAAVVWVAFVALPAALVVVAVSDAQETLT